MVRLLASVFVIAGCGEVPLMADALSADTADSISSDGADASLCGGAGQACCENDVCDSGLRCTPTDRFCRAASVWLAGTNGGQSGTAVVARSDGVSFTLTPLGTGQPMTIYGTSADDVWVFVNAPNDPNNAQTMWARHWNGTEWEPQVNFPVGFIINGVWGSAPNNYWAATNDGSVIHFDGTSWSQPQLISPGTVFGPVWGSGPNDVWILGGNVVAHWDGSGNWNVQTRQDFLTGTPPSMSGRASGEFFAGGYRPGQSAKPAVLHRIGANLTVETTGDGVDCATTSAVWAGLDDAWALTSALFDSPPCVATPTIVRYENATWTSKGKLPNASRARSLWGTSNKDLFASGTTTGDVPALFHYNGTNWTTRYMTSDVTYFGAIWGTGHR